MNNVFIENLRQSLPPTFSRRVAAENLKGLLSAGSLANIDSSGKGPCSFRLGRTVGYEKESFLSWLENRMMEGQNYTFPASRNECHNPNKE